MVIEDCSLLIEAAQPLLDPRPENLHSSDPQLVKDESFLKSLPVKVKINWPSMTDGDEWNKFNTNVFKKLVPVHSISDRVSHLENIIYEEASSLFGHITEESKLQHRYNFKKKRIIELVNTKNSILDQLSSANSEHDIVGLQLILDSTRKELRSIRKKDNCRKKRWLRNRDRKKFKKDPFKAGKDLLNAKSSVSLSVSQDLLDAHMAPLYEDKLRDLPLPPLLGLPKSVTITSKFDASRLSIDSFYKLLASRRNESSPGPNCIPYKVYKKCPQIAEYLFEIFGMVKRSGKIPMNWRIAYSKFIPKVDTPDSSKISDF